MKKDPGLMVAHVSLRVLSLQLPIGSKARGIHSTPALACHLKIRSLNAMNLLLIFIQILLALIILNVWIVRPRRATPFRGADAKTLREEFAAYGLPFWCMCVIGGLKVIFALALLVGIWVPMVAQWAAIGLGLLMLGAFFMHLKIKDPLQKALPSLALLVLCVALVLLRAAIN